MDHRVPRGVAARQLRPMRRVRPRPRRLVNPAEARAVKAAAPPRTWRPSPFVWWVLGRLVALAVLLSAAYVVYDAASSDLFQVRSVRVQGNLLLSRTEVEDVLAARGANIFWIDRSAAAARLRQLPLVQSAEVQPILPDSVQVRIVERQPSAFWVSGDQTYLVDADGVVLTAVDAETAQVRACAGQPCDPQQAPLPVVTQEQPQPLAPGDQVEASALSTSARLANLLPQVGVQPAGFQWSPDAGLEVPTQDGWRARFDDNGDLDQQVSTLQTVRAYLARTGTSAKLIDVRFGDRPYYQ